MKWRLLVVFSAAIVTIATGGSPVAAQDDAGTISVIIYHDIDGSGVRDDGEPRTTLPIDFSRNGKFIQQSFGGSTVFSGLEPANYTFAVVLQRDVGLCADVAAPILDPFIDSPCFINVPLRWRATSPIEVSVVLDAGQAVEVHFGVQPFDVAVITGEALLEDDFAPPGTVIEAIVNGQECGTTSTTGDTELDFILDILGAGEREGCAIAGDAVTFRVGSITAGETITWSPFVESGFRIFNLSAMEQHAWYWADPEQPNLPWGGAPVRALVDGQICGETTITGRLFTGFSRLIVPSEEIQPGCGRPGASVSILIDGEEVARLPWQPGLQRIDVGSAIGSPQLGHGPQERNGTPLAPLIAALAVGGTLILCGGLLVARRDGNRVNFARSAAEEPLQPGE